MFYIYRGGEVTHSRTFTTFCDRKDYCTSLSISKELNSRKWLPNKESTTTRVPNNERTAAIMFNEGFNYRRSWAWFSINVKTLSILGIHKYQKGKSLSILEHPIPKTYLSAINGLARAIWQKILCPHNHGLKYSTGLNSTSRLRQKGEWNTVAKWWKGHKIPIFIYEKTS